jgi:asparagine synthase (glutamine-hydrolysing)
VASNTGFVVSRYWDYPEPDSSGWTLQEAARRVRALLSDSVRLRLRSDVPVGTALSGGLDSASIAVLVREHNAREHHAFTATYPDSAGDESAAAQRVARNTDIKLHFVPATAEDFLPTLRRIVRHMESPTYSPAVIPLWKIMEAAREHVTVLLDGQGADEAFGGYTRDCAMHAAWDQARQLHLGRALSDIAGQIRIRGTVETMLFSGRTLAPGSHGLGRRLRGDEAVYAGPLREPLEDPSEEPNVLPFSAGLSSALKGQHRGTLVDLLHYGDAIGMAHSLELRSPFVDHRLVELAFRLPSPFKVRQGIGKVVLREAMEGLVPLDVRMNPMKLGFPVPIADWFRRWPERTWQPVLRSEACRSRGLFDRPALERLLRLHTQGTRDVSNELLRWITTEIWFQEFVD